MIKKITMSALITASLMTSAAAFEQEGVKKGNAVVGLDLRHNSQTYEAAGVSSTSTTTAINGTYSYFMTDAIEVGVSLGTSLSSSDTAGSQDTTSQNIGIIANYNFSDVSPTMVPYVGVNVAGYSSESNGVETDENGYGGEAGLKIFVSEKASIVPALYYSAFGEFLTETGAKVAVQVYF